MQERLRKALPDLLIAAILLLIPLIFYFPQTLGGRTLLPAENLYRFEPYRSLAVQVGAGEPHNMLLSDLVLENYVWKTFAREQLRSGELPLWQPYILGGSPFLAAGQSSALYPFNLLFLILPIPAAYGWFAVSQLWAAGLAMTVLARMLGIRRPGALIAAIAYQMSGFFLARVVFTMIVATAVWLPLLLALIELTIRQAPLRGRPASLPWAALGAGVLGMAALAGHAEALYYTLLVMAFYAAARLLAELIAGRGDWRHTLRRVAVRGAWLLALVGVGLALGAVQIIPSVELASRSARVGGNTLSEILSFAYPPRQALAFLMPNFYGSPAHHSYFDVFTWRQTAITVNALGAPIHTTEWGIKNYVEGGAYMGLLPLLLALIAVTHGLIAALRPRSGYARQVGAEGPGRPYRLIFAALAVVAVLIVFGTPFYSLLYHTLPFIDQSRAIFRWVWPLTLAMAVLAGFGAQVIREGAQNGHGRSERLISGVGWLAIGGGLLSAAGLAASRLLYDRIAGLVERAFNGLALANTAFPDARAFYSYEAANALWLALMLILSGGTLLLAARASRWIGTQRESLWAAFAAVVLAVDLAVPFAGFAPASDPTLLEAVPPAIGWLKERAAGGEPFRFMAYEEPGADTMNANIGWIHGLQDAAGYDSLIPGQYAAYMAAITAQPDLPYNRIAPLYTTDPLALDSPLLDLLNVRYIVTEEVIDSPKYALAYEDQAVRIYENLGALPRAFTLPFASTRVYFDSFGEEVLRSDVRAHVLIDAATLEAQPLAERERADLPPGTPSTWTPAAVTIYRPGEAWVDAAVEGESWLVLSESHFPGWRAWVRPIGGSDADEVEVPVRLVSGNFIGVYLGPGAWTVRLKYSPDSVRFGAFTSFMAGLLLIFAGAVWLWRRTYREPDSAGDAQRVAKNTITPIVLNLFNKGILFALTFVMLRVLGPGGAGEYRYAIVIWGWFEILANFGLNTYLMREVARHKDEANRYLVNTTLLRLALAVIGIPALAGFILVRQVLASGPIGTWGATIAEPLSAEVIWTIGLLYGGLFFSTISTGLTALFYAFEKAEYPAAIQTVSAFLTATLGVLALLLGWGIIGLAVVSVVVNAITLAILGTLSVRLFFKPSWAPDRGIRRAALSESFPLMINHLLATVFFRIAVILLEAIKGSVVVGWYSVVYTWVDTIGIIPSLFTQALFPVMSRQAQSDRPALKRSYILALKLMTLIAVPAAVLTTLLAYFLINVLGGPQYLPHGAIATQIFIWAMVIGWLNSVTQYVIIALNRQRTLTIAFAVGAAFNIIANLIFIPRYSYPAAAVIAILSEGVLLALFYLVILKELGRVNWAAVVGRLWLAGAAMGAAAWLLNGVNMWLAAVVAVPVYAAAVFLLRPFTPDEQRQLGAMLPARLRGRLIGGQAGAAG